jgi:outer membrane protein
MAVAVLMPASAALAAPADIGYVDFVALVASQPEAAGAQQTMKAAYEEAEKEFAAKSAGMNERDKRILSVQLQQQIDAKMLAVMEPIKAKVRAAIKEVADSKGLSAVLDKGVAIYGGLDITADVAKKLSGQ